LNKYSNFFSIKHKYYNIFNVTIMNIYT
jgi:hypothetical protein